MAATEELLAFLQYTSVKVYLVILAVAIWRCTSLYHSTLLEPKKKDNHKQKRNELSILHTIIPPLLSLSIIAITWFYIIRFIFTHQHTSESYFDDAYKDVLVHHYFSSTQLLTWAIVAVVWAADEGYTKSIPYLLYGFLGAMGASFVLWIPSRSVGITRKRMTVPLIYAITSLMAFVCILKVRPYNDETKDGDERGVYSEDQGFGSFSHNFRFWLHGLHVVLLLPIVITLLPIRQPPVDSALLYGIMGTVISAWHVSQFLDGGLERSNDGMGGVWSYSSPYTIPETDCQKSIHIDLVCCSILTLYAIYHDTDTISIGSIGDDEGGSRRAIRNSSISALLMPLISPAAVLAFHLCIERVPAAHHYLVGNMQRYMANQRRNIGTGDDDKDDCDNDGDGWCNLGLWNSTSKDAKGNGTINEQKLYETACKDLAVALGKEADLQPGDGVLSCGCGVGGKELNLYHSRFDLGHITGIDPCVRIDSTSFDHPNIRKIRTSVEDLISPESELTFRPHLFNKIVALDTIYHYPGKLDFFRYCMEVLPPGGKIAVTDIMWKCNDGGGGLPAAWITMSLSAMGVNSSSVWSESAYVQQLKSLGFTNITVKSIGAQVFSGWKGLLPNSLLQHLDYGIIVASKAGGGGVTTKSQITRKKRVAVIGSGMAGLSAANAIYAAAGPNQVEVKIFEAADRPGLAGYTMLLENQLVDVPTRMAAIGYYKEYIQLLRKHGIQYKKVKTDCTFHGRDGEGGYVKHVYELSAWKNLYNTIFVGGVVNLWRMGNAFSSIPQMLIDPSNGKGLSFGDWLHSHMNLYPQTSTTSNDPPRHEGWQFSYFARHANPFLYMTIGSFGWMLSCTYRQLLAYPSDILLPYIDGLGLTKFLGIFKEATVVRIEPSIRALEHALLYGIPFQGNTKVSNLDENKIIDGIEYDAIVCATEANAVQYVVPNAAKVFGSFHYHPSTLYLHSDPSVMPKNRADWRTFDVKMDPDHEEPQLIFWLNKYYDHIKFDGDRFLIWAPHKPPRDDCVIGKYQMHRVVHTSSAKEMVQSIQKEQGKNDIYYAGSYAVYGMGLLEEAVKSGKIAGERLVKDLINNE